MAKLGRIDSIENYERVLSWVEQGTTGNVDLDKAFTGLDRKHGRSSVPARLPADIALALVFHPEV